MKVKLPRVFCRLSFNIFQSGLKFRNFFFILFLLILYSLMDRKGVLEEKSCRNSFIEGANQIITSQT